MLAPKRNVLQAKGNVNLKIYMYAKTDSGPRIHPVPLMDVKAMPLHAITAKRAIPRAPAARKKHA